MVVPSEPSGISYKDDSHCICPTVGPTSTQTPKKFAKNRKTAGFQRRKPDFYGSIKDTNNNGSLIRNPEILTHQ
jgi:hypothetical protein